MSSLPPTQWTLLARLGDSQDREAWRQFVDIYAPVIFQYARRRGVQESDAADVTQEVLLRVAEALRRRACDPAKGRFRGWLFTVTRNELCDWLEARGRRERALGGSTEQQMLSELPAQEDADRWQHDYEQQLFAWAAQQVRGEVQAATWDAFWQTTIEQRRPAEVAANLRMSVAAVYLAKSRVMKCLRELVSALDDDQPANASPRKEDRP